MLTWEQYLLTKVSEECAEVAQRALKAQQFGFMEMQPQQPFTNAQRLHQELDDLLAAVDLLNKECHFKYEPDASAWQAKQKKIKQYATLSRKLKKLK